MTSYNQVLLNDGSVPKYWGFGCFDCSKLLIWRAEGSDRFKWKVFCTACLLGEMGYYVYLVWPKNWGAIFVSNDASGDDDVSNVLKTSCGLITLTKMLIETWRQDTPNWVCPGGIVLWCIIYLMIFPSLIVAYGVCTHNQDISFLNKDWVGFFIFLFGTFYSLSYEIGRFTWKKRLENKGKLHTIGLAKYCIHPNYLGDLFTYSGWAIITGTSCALSIPTGMAFSFIYLVCPNSDAYLAGRYSEFPEYASKTGTLFPGITNKYLNQLLAWVGLLASIYLGDSCSAQCSA